MKYILFSSLVFLTSCGMISLPDEHIEMEFDLQSKHIPKHCDVDLE